MSETLLEFSWETVTAIRDPVYDAFVDTDAFLEIYGLLLQKYGNEPISRFFIRSPLNTTLLIFTDSDAQERFMKRAIGMRLIPNMQELCEGESEAEKAARNRFVVRTKTVLIKKPLSNIDIANKKQIKMAETIDRLRAQLVGESNYESINRINDKIHRLTTAIQNPNTV